VAAGMQTAAELSVPPEKQ